MWVGYTPPPPENESHEYLSIERMVTEFEADNPDITIELQYVNSDNALQKATVAIQGNKQPDISYQYGTNMPQLAQSPEIVDLTSRVNEADYDWADFFPGEQAVATVDGKVLGVPALVDNLAIVYNKDLFAAAGVPEPTADWTWDDLRAAAAATTDPANKVFGLGFPVDGSETTVWQYIAMLWEAGGDILNADNTEAAFNSEAGRPCADHAQRDPAGRLDVPRLPAGLRQVRAAVQLGQDRDDHHRPVGPVRLPGRELRRPGHAVVRPGRQPRDDRRARQLGDLRQRTGAASTPPGSSSAS